MESVLFARYGVEPRARMLELRAPPVTLGVRETGSGEPALLMHGITLGAVHWASLMTRRPGLARTVSSYLREQFRGAPDYVLNDADLAGIRRPVLVIWGDRDDRYQPIAEGRRKTALIPGARFALVPGGHEPWLDDSEACAKVITEFLADQ